MWCNAALRFLSAFSRAEKGSVAIQFGLASVILVGLTALAVDFTGASSTRAKLRSAADSAALAGAKILSVDGTSGQAQQAAQNYLTAATPGITFTQTIDANVAAEQVTITLASTHPSLAGQLLGGPMTVGVTSIAKLRPPDSPPVCIHALDPSMSRAIDTTGGTAFTAECDVFVNSSSLSAVKMTGPGAGITATRICLRGGVSSGTMSPTPEDCGLRTDPFASMSPVTSSACTYTNYSGSSGTYALNPGVYCGGLNLTGGPTVTLNPGTYVIRDGQLKMSGGGSMTGTGVTFVFEGTASMDLSGGGTYRLIAPTSGQFKSFVFFQRPNANPNATVTMKGGGTSYFEGIIYLPTWDTVITGGGTASTPSPFSAYIAKDFRATGGSAIGFTYDRTRVTVPIPWQLFLEPRAIYLSN